MIILVYSTFFKISLLMYSDDENVKKQNDIKMTYQKN